MTDITVAAAHSALANVDLLPYLMGTIPLDGNTSTLFYRVGDKAEYVLS